MGKSNSKGRSTSEPRHVRLHHWMMKTAAWQSLSPNARCVLIEVMARFNGVNNGDITLSCRDAGDAIGRVSTTAWRAFNELTEKGFIKPSVMGAFTRKNRMATTWTLTEHEFNGQMPTKDFTKWAQ